MIALLALAAHMAQVPKAPQRALWTWHGQALVRDAQARQSFLSFLKAPKGNASHRISVIFLSEVDPSDPGSRPRLGDFLAECHRQGVRADFLCGDPSYAKPEGNARGARFVDQVLEYNASQPAAKQFDGFQFDVEPYALPGWPSPALRAGFLKLFEQAKAKIVGAGSHLALGAAIPRWFDAPDLNELYKQVLDRVDYVAVMDYVDTPARFIHDGAKTVAYATSSGKQAWLGAEATELPKEPMATFYAKGNASMEQAFSAAQRAFAENRGYAGVAIEYYESYLALRP